MKLSIIQLPCNIVPCPREYPYGVAKTTADEKHRHRRTRIRSAFVRSFACWSDVSCVWRVDLRRIPDGKPPRFPKKPTIRQEGDVLIMECILEAHPVPDITWYQGQKTIADSKRVKMSRKATSKDTYLLTLEISNPTKADGGNYRCNAFNNFGESNANISLNFQGKSFSKLTREGSHWHPGIYQIYHPYWLIRNVSIFERIVFESINSNFNRAI